MVDSGGSNETYCVFVTTNIDTRLGILLDKEDTVSAFKEKMGKEHGHSFPSVGKITVSALKVKRGDNCYHLPDSMLLRKAIQGVSNNDSFLYVDVIRVEEMVELQTREALAVSPKGAIGKDQEKDLAPTLQLVDNEGHEDVFQSGATETPTAVELNHTTDAENEGLVDGVNATCEAAIQNAEICVATEISTKDNGETVGEEDKSVEPKKKRRNKSEGVAEPVRRSKRPRVPNRRYTN